MRSVIFEGSGQPLAVRDVAAIRPGPGQLLLDVAACGICGSDLHAYQTGLMPPGTVFGHEFSGTVVEAGEDVGDEWKPGDRVIAMGLVGCGRCSACREERFEACPSVGLVGFDHPGAYSEQVVVQAGLCVALPASVGPLDGALIEPLAVGLAAFRDAALPLGGDVLIVGAGIIGIAVTKWARFFGAGGIGISDLEAARLDRAAGAGATVTIDARKEPDPVAAYARLTGREPSVVVECTGRPILQQLIDAAPRSAHLVVVGAGMEPEPILSVAATQKKLRVTFSFGYEVADFRFIVRMMDEGRLRTDGLVTRTVSLDEAPAAFASLLEPNEHCKVVIEP